MAAKIRTWRVFVPERDIPALLDMLRYDAATVQSWDRSKDARDRDGYTVTLSSTVYTEARWQSFGLYPVIVS